MQEALKKLSTALQGALYFNSSTEHTVQLLAYSTDASVYQERPLAVALPETVSDLKMLIGFARNEQTTLIPRAAGTSLAGQVVGSGIVVDMSKYFNRVLEINVAEKWVRVQPGVIRDDLNKWLLPHGLMFGPETSTANRAMIGGMIGNNSCGLHSIVWGDVRNNLIEVRGLLSDGSEVVFNETGGGSADAGSLVQRITEGIGKLLANNQHQQLIRDNFPKKSITRRNTGYALDSLLDLYPYNAGGEPFNLSKLIAGSEGTLMMITEARLRLIDLPPVETALVCVHCTSLQESLHANIVALKHRPMASELVDRYIMNFTRQHPEYRKNCFFMEGDPAALLMVEFMEATRESVDARVDTFMTDLKAAGLGYASPVLYNQDTKYAWDVRKAGLGLLRNQPGDTQPVNLIEDCAVAPDELPFYIADLENLFERLGVEASYYAHAGAGELHVEPMINLKTREGRVLFRKILSETAQLVKKYQGSLSGEHGDGRLRGEFIREVVGEETNALFLQVKHLFDPEGIFNRGKITAAPPMDTSFRMAEEDAGHPQQKPLSTYFDFSGEGGMLRLAEKCSGSGDCRKSEMTGGTMCPSYMATRLERDTTRARANVLRQVLSGEEQEGLSFKEVKEVLDLCLSCKGCKTECPSGVDVAKMKAEFLQQYYDRYGIPVRSKMIGNFARQMKLASVFPGLYNLAFGTPAIRSVLNRIVGFHPDRTMPLLQGITLKAWMAERKSVSNAGGKTILLFCDEFTNYYDVTIGITTVKLLEALGYTVTIPDHLESGRSFLSKGMVKEAKTIAASNIQLLAGLVKEEMPLVGIEPSAILTIRDEYIDLSAGEMRQQAVQLAAHTYTIEEFLSAEFEQQRIKSASFTLAAASIALHGHCYQKALSSQHAIVSMLSIPEHYQVQVIPSGCCGMAGSFGYEAEHFEISQQIGELVLFPTVRKLETTTMIAASGTSCRHQIKDGTGRIARHPVEILYEALLPDNKST
ncbi:FAD-binding and (Fe-S)-binding domain-containing protein [Flavihumibacter petaseus]|uniref:Putative oxidoreductase n=1 Tax=Flavihumibacter petaseus NBRC 106054 TaxID=1220578 RepID=A0A0E9N4Y2_9BACT|nr:FAD-binding and (Fe-S)-binding domain-containing protein [Flavihumibacter petaseus]GAO44869.1 putative oxidoreductase [Flavihumibacter petaseus NBRC 106054]